MKPTCKRLVASALALLTALSVIVPVAMPTVSAMDQAEYEQKTYYKNGASPMTAAPTTVTLTKGTPSQREENYTLSLDGTWKMTSSGKIADLAAGRGWNKAYDATVPGSIYTPLVEAGVIDDPYVGDNMKKANKQSQKSWYFLRTFTYEGKGRAGGAGLRGPLQRGGYLPQRQEDRLPRGYVRRPLRGRDGHHQEG